MGLSNGLQSLLQFLDAGFPMLSTDGQITNRDPQLPNLLLFFGAAQFPQITAGPKFFRLASSIPGDIHHSTSERKLFLGGTRIQHEVLCTKIAQTGQPSPGGLLTGIRAELLDGRP